MNFIAKQTRQKLELCLDRALFEQRRQLATRTALWLRHSGYTYCAIAEALWEIFGERFTLSALRMREHVWKKKRRGAVAAPRAIRHS